MSDLARRIERVLRIPARAAYHPALRRRAEFGTLVPSPAPAIVFSPHPDDETLACGATIARKRHVGAPVTIVEMTDGAASNPELIDAERMRALRAAETLAASAALGVAEQHVVFLGYPDGRLDAFHDDAVRRVETLLEEMRPEEIFVPYHDDVHPDHVATYAIVCAALEGGQRAWPAPVVYEYPVWFLHHWPLVDETAGGRVPVLSTLRWGLRRALVMLRDFGASTDARPVLAEKRDAVRCHRTQTTRYLDDPRWHSLADIGDGEFLALFLREHEVFHRTAADDHHRGPRGSVKA